MPGRASDGVPDPQDCHRPDHGDEEAPDIEAGYAGSTEGVEEPTANHRPDNAEHDVKREPLAAAC